MPGALLAGLMVGLIQALSAYYLGPIYKDVVVYALVRGGAVGPAAGPAGERA